MIFPLCGLKSQEATAGFALPGGGSAEFHRRLTLELESLKLTMKTPVQRRTGVKTRSDSQLASNLNVSE